MNNREPIKDCFQKRLTTKGREAFDKLCNRGCDKEYLTLLLLRLCNTDPIYLSDEGAVGEVDKLTIPHLDSLTPEEMFGEFDLRKLGQIATRAKKLEDEIQRLKKTEFVQALWRDGRIPETDLLATRPLEGLLTPTPFASLLSLPELAKEYHPSRRPSYTTTLIKIIKHVVQCTGGWHDAEIGQILDDLFPDAGVTHTQAYQKRWREIHGLKTIRVKTKKGKLINSLPR